MGLTSLRSISLTVSEGDELARFCTGNYSRFRVDQELGNVFDKLEQPSTRVLLFRDGAGIGNATKDLKYASLMPTKV